jgi:uncharacterized protein (TIGR03083 family)
MDTWQAINSERASLADALAGLPDDAWDRPSLCAQWSVREVVGHMVATARMTTGGFFGKLLGSGFNFGAMTRKDIDDVVAGKSPAELVAAYRGYVDARNAPPGPTPSWLGETIVHGEDVFRALDGYRAHPVEHVVAVADFYKNSNLLIGAKKRVAGVTLKATDATWSNGTGPEVSGPIIALVMAMTGRRAALDDLSGDGVETLRSR